MSNIIAIGKKIPKKVTETFQYGIPNRLCLVLGDVVQQIEENEKILVLKKTEKEEIEIIAVICHKFFQNKNTYGKDPAEYYRAIIKMADIMGATFVIEALNDFIYEENLPPVDAVRRKVSSLISEIKINIIRLNRAKYFLEKSEKKNLDLKKITSEEKKEFIQKTYDRLGIKFVKN